VPVLGTGARLDEEESMKTFRLIPSTRWVLMPVTAGLAVVWACAGGPGPGTPAQNVMRVHFDAANRVQMAIVAGDLRTARAAAADVWAAESAPDLGPDAVPYIRAIQERARDVRNASIYGEAALATGRLAAACGSCHVQFQGGPRLAYAEAPPDGSGLDRHVVRHVWAADRLWEGLLGPSSEAWQLGAELLAHDELGGAQLSATAMRHASRLNEFAAEALDTTDPQERGVLYGRILSTCGACHAEAPGGA
jgi:hypothetical protein